MVYFLCKAYDSDRQNCYFAQSLPVRGAWIEMAIVRFSRGSVSSLPVRGAWIEMLSSIRCVVVTPSRSPCGERGLKCFIHNNLWMGIYVAPRAGSVD